jgi:hypothetical protein
MKHLDSHSARIVVIAGAALGLMACAGSPSAPGGSAATTVASSGTTAGSTASTVIEAALPLIRTGAAVATGAVLDFTVQQSSTRTRLANEMYAAAGDVLNAVAGGIEDATQSYVSTPAAAGSGS